MTCRLILNADDFGWSSGVNRAVTRLFDEGVLSSASLMVTGPAFPEAREWLASRPELSVGLHAAAAFSPPLLPAEEIPHLVDGRGWLGKDPIRLGLRYTLRPACRRELRRELAAQFSAFAALRRPWSHVDTHVHMSLTPVVFRIIRELALQYRVPGLRIPHDDFFRYYRYCRADAIRQVGMALGFSALSRLQRASARNGGFVTARRCYGFFRTGRLTADYLERLIGDLPDGDFELHCHPDFDSPGGREEFDALSSAAFQRALRKRGVKLITYPQLAREGSARNLRRKSRR